MALVKSKNIDNKEKALKAFWTKNKNARIGVLLVVVAILGFLLYQNKQIFVVASVNGQPVWRWELDAKLTSRYGSQTLDEISSELLIHQAAQSKGITVTQAEVTQKVSDIEKSLQGKTTLADALTQQGMTMTDLRNQIELQALMEKMNTAPVTVSDQEIADYIDKNKSFLTATDEAGMKAEATKAVSDSKKTQALQTLFADLKAKAKISKFL